MADTQGWSFADESPVANGWSFADAPTPEDKPGILSRAITNLPRSAKNLYTQGMGASMGGDQSGQMVDGKWQQAPISGPRDWWNAAKEFAHDPVGSVKNVFAEDPLGTAAMAGGLTGVHPLPESPAMSGVGAAAKAMPSSVAENVNILHPLRSIPRVAGDVVDAYKKGASSARTDIAAARNRVANPPQSIPPLDRPAPPELTPIPATQTLSGRSPGPVRPPVQATPAPRTPTQGAAYGNQIPDLTPIRPPSRTLPSGKTVPIPGQPNPIQDAMTQAKKTVDARPAAPAAAPPDIPAPSAQGPPAPSTGNALADKYYLRGHPNPTAAAARDHALTDWALKQKVDYSDVQPGQPFADMIKQANTDLHKSYRAEIGRADHGQRVQDFKDLLKSKMGPALEAPEPE